VLPDYPLTLLSIRDLQTLSSISGNREIEAMRPEMLLVLVISLHSRSIKARGEKEHHVDYLGRNDPQQLELRSDLRLFISEMYKRTSFPQRATKCLPCIIFLTRQRCRSRESSTSTLRDRYTMGRRGPSQI
jgi:hypothetical protein